jgi:hypothetical protein
MASQFMVALTTMVDQLTAATISGLSGTASLPTGLDLILKRSLELLPQQMPKQTAPTKEWSGFS